MGEGRRLGKGLAVAPQAIAAHTAGPGRRDACHS
jgi:hypothetical protein